MNLEHFTARLSHNADVICSLASGVTEEQVRWKPEPEAWSILEVINHLYDEEREDFQTRLDLLLHHPGQSWPGIDPAGWVIERQYNQRNPAVSLHNFLKERQGSITWLENLSEPNWEQGYNHPQAGHISAADMLAAWVAHDFLHIRQLIELHWLALSQLGKSYAVAYAGAWE